MRKFIIILFALAITLVTTACTKTESDPESSEVVSDPFAEKNSGLSVSENPNDDSGSDSSFDDTTDGLWEQTNNKITDMLTGGYLVDYGSAPLIYNGEPIKMTLTITTDEGNKVDRSVGVMALIDDMPQEVSLDGETYSYMAVYTGLKPNKAYTKELYLKPSVLPEDRENPKVHFADCDTPDFRATEQCMSFWGVHSFSGYRGCRALVISNEIENPRGYTAETNVREEINTYKKGMSNIVKKNSDKTTGYCLNEDGTLSGTYVLYYGKETKHRIVFFINDRPVTFNGGKDFCDIEFKDGYMYTFDFTLDEKPEQMDIFYALDLYTTQEDYGDNPCVSDDGPYVVVRHDFVDEHYLKYKGL